MPTTTNYIWDEDNILAEADGTNAINTVYTNEPQQYGNLISTRIGSETSYHQFDALGSTRQLTNAVGHVTDTVIYDAWGNVVGRTGTTDVMLLWIGIVGYYFDPETGLFAVRERPYGPAIGRWLSVDPLWTRLAADAFIYCRNSPLVNNDPSGLFCQAPPCQRKGTWDPEDCLQSPACTCSEARGKNPIGAGFPIAELVPDLAKQKGREVNCPVYAVTGDCDMPKGKGGSWTCRRTAEKGPAQVFICISGELSYCEAIQLLKHEMYHARQLCLGAPGCDINDLTKCIECEYLGYVEQLKEDAAQKCEKPPPKPELERKARTMAREFSCNKEIVGNVPPCSELVPKWFPNVAGK